MKKRQDGLWGHRLTVPVALDGSEALVGPGTWWVVENNVLREQTWGGGSCTNAGTDDETRTVCILRPLGGKGAN